MSTRRYLWQNYFPQMSNYLECWIISSWINYFILNIWSPFQIVFLKPIWTYGIQLWGCTKQSNIDIIQCFQNKVLRNMVNAPWYVRNNDLHRDLQVNVVSCEIQRFTQKHEERLHHHENGEAILLLDNAGIVRRLQRKKTFGASLSDSIKAETVLV